MLIGIELVFLKKKNKKVQLILNVIILRNFFRGSLVRHIKFKQQNPYFIDKILSDNAQYLNIIMTFNIFI